MFIESYHTLIPLANYFSGDVTFVTWTIRENRQNFPVQLREVVLKKGWATFYEHKDIIITKYNEINDSCKEKAKVTYILNTAHGTVLGDTNRWEGDGNVI